jgi:CRISPR/Cas system endoribonuclease Cas6 (RAMP superfamily)
MMSYDLRIQRLFLSVQVTRRLPDTGELFRVRSLYQAALAAESPCSGSATCGDQYACPLHTAFAQELSADPELVRRHQKPPLPFAWQVPLRAELHPGDLLTVALTLVGRAATQIASHVHALQRLFTHDQLRGYDLMAITLAGTDGRLTPWPLASRTEPPELPAPAWDDLLIQAGQPPAELQLELATPLRLMSAGRVTREFDASLFVRHVVRRCSSLAAYYGDTEVAADYQSLAATSYRLHANNVQLRQVKLAGGTGICGRLGLAGELTEFWPWLQLGQLLNVGKGAAFGYGHYRLR